jgi:hypothetical protein
MQLSVVAMGWIKAQRILGAEFLDNFMKAAF